MVNIECAVEGCEYTFTNSQGLYSHFAFTHSLPAKQSEYEETKNRIESAQSGDSNSKYPENWEEIRREVLDRDGHQCQQCGATGGEVELHAHHITPISEGGGHELDNLTTLCQECHDQEHSHSIVRGSDNQRNPFQKNGEDLLIECGICGDPAILQRNPGLNHVICENCGEYRVPGSE